MFVNVRSLEFRIAGSSQTQLNLLDCDHARERSLKARQVLWIFKKIALLES
jgi:hypothetical protein